jgi:hypothetical protein
MPKTGRDPPNGSSSSAIPIIGVIPVPLDQQHQRGDRPDHREKIFDSLKYD